MIPFNTPMRLYINTSNDLTCNTVISLQYETLTSLFQVKTVCMVSNYCSVWQRWWYFNMYTIILSKCYGWITQGQLIKQQQESCEQSPDEAEDSSQESTVLPKSRPCFYLGTVDSTAVLADSAQTLCKQVSGCSSNLRDMSQNFILIWQTKTSFYLLFVSLIFLTDIRSFSSVILNTLK
jgi:hypothetical protein